MNYIHTPTGEYPISQYQIKARFPQTSFPSNFVPPEGYALVQSLPFPDYNPITQAYRELPPVEVNGQWVQQWEVYTLTPEEVATNQAAAAQALQDGIVSATQQRLDTFARTRNYDGILSACTYAASTVPTFQAEGQYCVNARDNTWATLYQMLAEVQAGTRPVPTSFADIEPELPVLAWPA